jgi:hypothetical protein
MVVILPFPQCRHMPSIENRKFQKHILVEWEFDQQPDSNKNFMHISIYVVYTIVNSFNASL